MKKLDIMDQRHPIATHSRNNQLSMIDLCRALNCVPKTMREYIDNPYLMRMGDIVKLAGLFGITSLELFYSLQRNIPNLKRDKNNQFHLSEIMRKVEEDEIRYRKQKDQV